GDHAVVCARAVAGAVPEHYRIAGAPSTAPAFIGEDSLLASVWRVVMTRGLVAEAEIHEAIPADTHPDRRTLAQAAQPPMATQPAWPHTVLLTHPTQPLPPRSARIADLPLQPTSRSPKHCPRSAKATAPHP
ncbi:hypothetical protein ACWDAQ_27930, partial [Streptomyces sp. NPDC001139]